MPVLLNWYIPARCCIPQQKNLKPCSYLDLCSDLVLKLGKEMVAYLFVFYKVLWNLIQMLNVWCCHFQNFWDGETCCGTGLLGAIRGGGGGGGSLYIHI